MSGVAAAEPGGVWVVTGISAAGKSTVAAALAERFERSVLVEGDLIRELVRGGREEMGPDASPEALAQLRLRYEVAASIASRYAGAGFTCVWDDVVLGAELPTALARVTARPLRLVVLAPDAATDGAREAGRAKDGYHRFDVAGLDRILREETPRLGLWLDTTRLSVAETVDAILGCAGEALVEPGDWSTGAGDVSGGAAAARCRSIRMAGCLRSATPAWRAG